MHPNEVRLVALNGDSTSGWYIASEEAWDDPRKREALSAQRQRQADELFDLKLRIKR